jgi:hypothetical protein
VWRRVLSCSTYPCSTTVTHHAEVARSDDQEEVEASAPQRADPAITDWGTEDPAAWLPLPACTAARPRRHRRPESWTGARSTPPGVVGHMLGQQAVDDVGGSRQLGYQGVPLIHDHSTMDARSQPRERTRPCQALAWRGTTALQEQPGCGDRQGRLEAMGVHGSGPPRLPGSRRCWRRNTAPACPPRRTGHCGTTSSSGGPGPTPWRTLPRVAASASRISQLARAALVFTRIENVQLRTSCCESPE